MEESARYTLHHFDGRKQGDYNAERMRNWFRRIPIRLTRTLEAVERIGFDVDLL